MGALHMKKILILSGLMSMLFIASCSNAEGTGESLIDNDSVIEGTWINYNGEETEDSEMRTTEAVEYDPSNDYEINRSSYVSYYNGDEFLETILYGEEPPMNLEKVENADSIRISFNAYNEDSITLLKVN